MVTAGSRELGPGNGTLLVHTTRQGFAAQVGHDLTLEVTRWSGTLDVAEDPADSTLKVTVETGALRVVEGSGGIKPLSDRDRREILANARKILGSDAAQRAVFVSTSTTAGAGGGGGIDGALTLRGTERPMYLEVTYLGDARYRAVGTVVQSEYGIKPYSAMLGALKIADPIGVDVEVDLAGEKA